MCGIEQKLYARIPIGSGPHDNSSYPVGMDTLELRSGSNAQRHGELAGAWLASLLSDHTVRAYRRDLTELFDFLDLGGVDVLMAGRKHLDAWRRSMTGSTTTVARKLSAASSFFRYAMEVDAIEYNPITRVRRPKIDPDFTKTQGLTRRQAEDFLAAAAADGPRSDALSNVLLLTGIRVGEALKSDTDDLRFESGHRVLAITRKGGWAGRVVLPPLAVDALAQYLGKGAAEGTELARTSADISHPIFTTSTGRRWQQSEAYRTIRRIAANAGIPGIISPHSLRHTHATLALEAGVSLADLQDSLGQADPRTTRRYDRARGRLERSSAHAVSRLFA